MGATRRIAAEPQFIGATDHNLTTAPSALLVVGLFSVAPTPKRGYLLEIVTLSSS